MSRSTGILLVCGFAMSLVGAAAPPATAHHRTPTLDFRGEATIPSLGTFEGTGFGGLSSIAYDHRRDVYYAISDAQADARFYTLRVAVDDGRLTEGDVTVLDVTTLLGPDGEPFPAGSLDPEGLALTKRGTLIITSEGFALAGQEVAPWVREFALDGTFLRELALPSAYDPVVGVKGVRQNLGLESAALTPNGQELWTGTENALVQDGPPATLGEGSPSRLLRFDVRTGELEQELVYVTEPVAEPPVPAGSFTVNGLVELLPLGKHQLIAMERSFSVGAGNSVQLFLVDTRGATDVTGLEDLDDAAEVEPVDKQLLFDLNVLEDGGLLDAPLDNVEGMTLGPRLRRGQRALVLVSDDNFAGTQVTQFLLFAFDEH